MTLAIQLAIWFAFVYACESFVFNRRLRQIHKELDELNAAVFEPEEDGAGD